MLPLPRPVIAAWAAAIVVASVPTWWLWEERLTPEQVEREWGATTIYGMVRQFNSVRPTPVLSALVDDLGVVAELAYTWALPAVLVLAGLLGCLRQSDPEAVGAAGRVRAGGGGGAGHRAGSLTDGSQPAMDRRHGRLLGA